MGTLRQILELEGSRPTKRSRLIISLPRCQLVMPPRPDNSVLEIFGEMEFRERSFGVGTPYPSPSPSPASTPTALLYSADHPQFGGGSEDIEDVGELGPEKIEPCERRTCLRCNPDVGSRVLGAEFPAPISSIGRNGKPRVYYQSIKERGRLVLKEIRIPSQQCMHACRENGRLVLQLGNPNRSEDD